MLSQALKDKFVLLITNHLEFFGPIDKPSTLVDWVLEGPVGRKPSNSEQAEIDEVAANRIEAEAVVKEINDKFIAAN